jgi:membrane-anchored protein YejM (alkaline phosphatase superfamily)
VNRPPAHGREWALHAFVLVNFLFACAHAQRYLAVAGSAASGRGVVFAGLALSAQVGLFVLAVSPILWLTGRAEPYALAQRLLGAVAFTLLHAFLYADSRIFALFKFHFNGLVLNVLFTPGGWESMELPARDVATAVAGLAGLFALELLGYTVLLRRAARGPGRAAPVGRRWRALVALVLGLVVTERGVYLAADALDARDVTRQASRVPFYEPLAARRSVARVIGLPADGPPVAADPREAILAYPRAPLAGRVRPDRRWNVVWIAVESWRADVFTPDNTPGIWAFSRRAQVFTRHQSGGNSTRFGIFSMFYGLYGSYWWPFVTESRGPVLIDTLLAAGYRMKVVSSTSLRYPEFRRTAFVTVLPWISDQPPGRFAPERDVETVRTFEAFVDGHPADQPFFAFLFLDTPHFPFMFPPDYAKYVPMQDPSVADTETPAGVRSLFNRYRNAVLYADALVSRIVRLLETRGLLDRTIVLLTGDHGQEFWEHGFFGHGSAFTPEQTGVPLILYVPGLAFREHDHLTQHLDLPATVLTLLGVDDPPDRYSLGRDMLGGSPRPYAVICGYRDCALQDADGWLVFGIEGKTTLLFDARDRDYREVKDRAAAVRERTATLAQLMREMRLFLR